MHDAVMDRLTTRRRLLAGGAVASASALGAAGGYLAGREVEGGDAGTASHAGRGPLFELDPRYVNLTTFVLAGHPRPVREAIERHRSKLDENAALTCRRRRPSSRRRRAPRWPGTSA
jgi:hypothetical protein